MATISYDVRRFAAPVAAMLLLTACSGGDESSNATRTPSASPTTSAPTEPSPTATPTPSESETAEPEPAPEPKPYPVSLPAYFEREPDGGDLRLGAVRERTAAYTSYDASYRSGHLRVTGVLNIPTGKGPFPAVVLAHGYIDPAIYVSGQGMTRERGYLATQGFVAFHVDYRNHAGLRQRPAGRAPAADWLRTRRDQRRTGPAPLTAGAGRRRPDRRLRPLDGRRRGLQGTRDRARAGGCRDGVGVGRAHARTRTSTTSSATTRVIARRWSQFVAQEYGLPGAARLREVLAADQRPHVLRPHHRAGAARPRQVRLDLPAGLGPGVVPSAPRGGRRRAAGVVPGRARLRPGVLRGHGPHDRLLPCRAVVTPSGACSDRQNADPGMVPVVTDGRLTTSLRLVTSPPLRQGMPADCRVDGGLGEEPRGVEQRHG